MSPARRAARAGRNLLIALLVGAVVIVAIVVAYVASRPTSTPSVLPGEPTIVTRPAGPPSDDADVVPTGCLGGPARTNEMLLTAQKSAPHTTYGAVEVASAFYRWSYRYPVPSRKDVQAINALFVPSERADAQSSLLRGYEMSPNPAAGTVPDGTPFYVTSVGGRWILQSDSSAAAPVVGIQEPYVIGGAVSATKTATAAFEMRWTSGAWRISALRKGEPERVAAGGTTFTAGC